MHRMSYFVSDVHLKRVMRLLVDSIRAYALLALDREGRIVACNGGLALTKDLVSSHGGTIQVRGAGPGKGSEFIVRLGLIS